MNIAIIPARGGSTRIERKNIRLFHGKPIIAYSIEAAKETELFDRIYVSTEDPEIAEVALDLGAQVLARSAEMAENDVGTYDVMVDAVNELDLSDEDNVCCIYATSPMIDYNDIKVGRMFMITQPIGHAISISYPPLQDAAQFYWSRVDALRQGIGYFTIATGLVRINPALVCDINTMQDWAQAERMYNELENGRLQ